MRLNAPTFPVFVISLIVAILALVSLFVPIPILSAYAFWLMLLAYVLLVAGCVMKGV
jgi:hypothetical protein